ncbi:hypothetical protein QN277_011800 [Acacia crassicarpa]|uniref:Uncharacterized protein n=1 Tax=Acacia crassicarpa TaxID=499986 RepID=A0AAE1MZS9_9FABA|nr:hypothetical protein QN277_011800 [Acacia crassicarpa]
MVARQSPSSTRSKNHQENRLEAAMSGVQTCVPTRNQDPQVMFINFGLVKDRGGGCYLRFISFKSSSATRDAYDKSGL